MFCETFLCKAKSPATQASLFVAQQEQRGVRVLVLHKNTSLISFFCFFFPSLLLNEQNFNEAFNGENKTKQLLYPLDCSQIPEWKII